MGNKQSMAASLPWTRFQSTTSGPVWVCCWFMGFVDMLSTPAPIPMVISPAAIRLAILAQACNPDAHCRLMVCKAVDSGIPATIWAMRRAANPTGGCNKTLPTQTSSMAAPSTPVRCNVSARTVSNNVAGGTWARPPLRARQRGVRVAQTITTSASSRVLVVGDGMVSYGRIGMTRLLSLLLVGWSSSNSMVVWSACKMLL
mmetsp:Transcript_3183/g.6383  ORF Transcript_3183/g.6383 Transcript_3183/m.6383 type:complete len:201 (-) Transcript_3183:40-642(-)